MRTVNSKSLVQQLKDTWWDGTNWFSSSSILFCFWNQSSCWKKKPLYIFFNCESLTILATNVSSLHELLHLEWKRSIKVVDKNWIYEIAYIYLIWSILHMFLMLLTFILFDNNMVYVRHKLGRNNSKKLDLLMKVNLNTLCRFCINVTTFEFPCNYNLLFRFWHKHFILEMYTVFVTTFHKFGMLVCIKYLFSL